MTKVLITGYNGLVGTELINKLVTNKSFEIYGLGRSDNPNLEIIFTDLNKGFNQAIFPDKMDVIIHLAQSEKFRDFPDQALDIFSVNTASTLHLLDYAKRAGVSKFIYASTGGVYGGSAEPLDESIPITANGGALGFYQSTKLCSELLVQNYSQFFEVNILRFFFVYGPEQKREMLIPRLMNSVKNGISIKLIGDGGIKMNPIYVSDAAESIVSVVHKKNGNRIFNIAGNEIIDLRSLCKIIGRIVGKLPEFEVTIGDNKTNLIADITLMKELLGNPVISLEEGLKKLNQVMFNS
jgi:nucleoside-diphosphate-sugar epimerase